MRLGCGFFFLFLEEAFLHSRHQESQGQDDYADNERSVVGLGVVSDAAANSGADDAGEGISEETDGVEVGE